MKNKSILITGGTGSFGKNFIKYIYKKHKNLKKIVVFSRDELKQFEMKKKINKKHIDKFRFFIGDVRDQKRLIRAFDKIDIVIHAAALKQVDTGEYDPLEFVNTNILGAQNIIEASLSTQVKKVIALSTDKAAAPVNLYGATKLCSDKLFSSANNLVGNKDLKFSIVRYGNVLGSRGSVVPAFLSQKKSKTLFITDKEMTRFNISLKESINLVLWSLKNSEGGEIFIPKLPSFKIMDLAKAICAECKIKYIGTRRGEKIHEELISEYESEYLYDFGKYYGILSPDDKRLVKKKITKKFSYNSKDNNHFLNINQIKKILSKHV